MSNYMIPVDDEYVEAVAMAIARNRLFHDACNSLSSMTGISMKDNELLTRSFDIVFERLWKGNSEIDIQRKNAYMDDARAAIAAINLKLLTKV